MGKIAKVAVKAARADHKVTHHVARHRDAAPVKFLGGLSEVADQPPLIALGTATILGGLLLRQPAVLRSGVRMLGSELLATAAKSGLKRLLDRTRPAKAIERGATHFAPGTTVEHDENSFPSGHTAGAVAVARAVTRDAPAAALPATVAAGAVAAIQLPRGKHYLSDVVAGAAIGYAAEKATSIAIRIAEAAIKGAVKRR